MREGWTYKKLGEVCEIYQPKTLSTEDLVADGDYPVYGANGIIGRFNSYNHEFPEVLLTCRGATCGRINISQPFSWINGNAMVIHRKSDDLSFDFLKYVMFSLDYSLIITGAAQPQITRQKLAPTVISYPPLSEQQSIVAELDKINELISLKKAQLSDLDSLAQSIFYDMFGDPIVNEKGWEVKKLGDECVDMKYGTSRPASENGRYKYLRMGNITSDGHLDLLDLKYIDIPDEEVEKCIVRHGDILFNRTNSYELIGKTCMFDLLEPMIIAGYIIRVRLSNNLHPRYVSIMFNLPSFKKLLRSKAKGAVNQANINSKELASIRIPLPPLPLQQEFAKRIELIEQQKVQISSTIKDLETLLASRMQYWFD